jgi:hypothetical protein
MAGPAKAAATFPYEPEFTQVAQERLRGGQKPEDPMPIQCDFCAHRHCTWRYRVVAFQPDDPRNPRSYKVEEWAACRVCYDLIQAEDYPALAVRTVHTINNNPAVFPTDTVHQDLVRGFLDHYEEFAAHRLGPPLPFAASPEGFDDLFERAGMRTQAIYREQVGGENGGPSSRPQG